MALGRMAIPRDYMRNRAAASASPLQAIRSPSFPSPREGDYYRPGPPSNADTKSRPSEKGREIPRSVPSTYNVGDRSRERSRSPCSGRREPIRDDHSSAIKYRARSPLPKGRRLTSYTDLDNPTNWTAPSTIQYSDSGSCRSNARMARPRDMSMKESDPTRYYEFAKGEFKPGTIIRAPLHEEDVNRTSRYSSTMSSGMTDYQSSRVRSHVSHTPHGAVWSESRFLIVVQKFALHYTAIPLFTYEGTGLRHKPDIKEYVSIEDHRYPGMCKGEAPNTLRTAYLAPSVDAMRSTSVAHLTYPVPRKYKLRVKYQGRLEDEGTELLVKLFKELNT